LQLLPTNSLLGKLFAQELNSIILAQQRRLQGIQPLEELFLGLLGGIKRPAYVNNEEEDTYIQCSSGFAGRHQASCVCQ
jgi:hypothetical protein